MHQLSRDEIAAGKCAYRLWYFIGDYVIAPYKITDTSLIKLEEIPSDKYDLVKKHIKSVLLTSVAINKMMGRPDTYGMFIVNEGKGV